jgi:membrane associated rhomboid family serine protease
MATGSRRYARPYLAGGGLPSVVKALLIVNTALFLIFFFARGSLSTLLTLLALTPASVVHSFALWQPVTYMFLHSGVMGFLFNMLALWMFGRVLEETWGSSNFLKFYFVCGVGAGLFAIIACYIFGAEAMPVVGSTGAIYGILAAYAALWPEQDVIFFFFPMKVKWFVLLIAAVDFLLTFGAVGYTALLMGLPIGYFYVKAPKRRTTATRINLLGTVRGAYRDWRMKRAKRKFQVYLKKQGSGRDPWVN